MHGRSHARGVYVARGNHNSLVMQVIKWAVQPGTTHIRLGMAHRPHRLCRTSPDTISTTGRHHHLRANHARTELGRAEPIGIVHLATSKCKASLQLHQRHLLPWKSRTYVAHLINL